MQDVVEEGMCADCLLKFMTKKIADVVQAFVKKLVKAKEEVGL